MIKQYKVEFKKEYTDDFDNWICDDVEAESEVEAEDLAKTWLVDHGYEGDVNDLLVQVTEVRTRIGAVDGQNCYYDAINSCVTIPGSATNYRDEIHCVFSVEEAIEKARAKWENFKPVR